MYKNTFDGVNSQTHRALLPKEQAFVDRVFGSFEQIAAKTWADIDQKLDENRKWRIAVDDIRKHPRAISFEEALKLPCCPLKTLGPLLKSLTHYHYPFLAERLITPAACRHLWWIRRRDKQRNDNDSAKNRRREFRKNSNSEEICKKSSASILENSAATFQEFGGHSERS
jgi:hypothetical protein